MYLDMIFLLCLMLWDVDFYQFRQGGNVRGDGFEFVVPDV